MYKPEREQALARTALALMGECNVIATPENFELFYAYASGENAAITRTLGGLIAARQPITPDILTDLRMRCLAGARAARAMDDLGEDMRGVIDEVMGKLAASARDASDYNQRLRAASGALDGNGQNPGDLRALVEGLVAATRAMEARAKILEDELRESSAQVSDLRTKLDSVRKESMTDPLTGIANRKAFDDAMRQAVEQVGGEGECAALLLCDIDHFKAFNDRWGHQTGDQVLRLVAGCLADNVKGRDMAARYGGEEFVVLLRGTNLAAATTLANQIRAAVQVKKLVKKSTGDVLGAITISVGVAQIVAGDTAEAVIRRADACLYGAKHHGRNMVINQNDPRMAALEPDAA